METNFYGPLRCIKAVLPTMRAQKSGTIVNNGSLFGTTYSLGGSGYSASKFALEALTEGLRVELVGTLRLSSYLIVNFVWLLIFFGEFLLTLMQTSTFVQSTL